MSSCCARSSGSPIPTRWWTPTRRTTSAMSATATRRSSCGAPVRGWPPRSRSPSRSRGWTGRKEKHARAERGRSTGAARRKVPAVDRLLEEFLRVVLPELGDGRHRHDDGVLELAVAVALHLADVDVLDRIVVAVELHGAARRIAELHLAQHGQQLLAILHGAAQGLDRLVDPPPTRVIGLREIGRHLAEARPVL